VENSGKTPSVQRESAETLALQAVSWLATDADLLGAFLNESGASLSSLVVDLKRPEFLAAVLDFVLGDDQRVLALAAQLGIRPEDVALRRAHLHGGDLPNWT
jgi:hypothetical protein